MKVLDLVGTAVRSTFRSLTRTVLTILAIFVGAFTLTLTTGLGTGINAYIDDTVASLGAGDVMTVTKPADDVPLSGPREYDPDTTTARGPGNTVTTLESMDQTDLDALAEVAGVLRVDSVPQISVDYIAAGDGTPYVIGVAPIVDGQELQLAAGAMPDDGAAEYELGIPVSYVEPLGFSGDADALGATVEVALTDGDGAQQSVEATVVAVVEETFTLTGTGNLSPNEALADALVELQAVGVPEDDLGTFTQADLWFAADATDDEITALEDDLAALGYDGVTVAQQLGALTDVIDGIVLVLNGFAVIALLAAGFGIVNTLLMSVQERTREIGLMKAMGMGSGRVFTLFSLEATFIGFLGSAIGVLIGMVAGRILSRVLTRTVLSDLPGLQLIAFDPAAIAAIVLVVMAIAFVAGTIPALRAARQDPVASLRYE
ncbi:ABC transporter permease [Microbacterium thalassium]|uniref:Putative ABC transport system permease protein n=1 Tax=Microbacterium thalassium TaxID=362649 RepID=A0A7X0FS18_9MICO|nr:ABC transporter permease [Microbacterium thalassium]MBB6392663.1 putative ABC transport system permease protein [Microbacterium thalassium]GLK23106.1 permease [Microbacterium thalassium]